MGVPPRPHRQPLHRHCPPCGPGGGGPGGIAQNLLPRLWVAVGRPRARHGEGRVPRPGGKEGSSCFLKYWGTPSGRAPEERAKCGSSVSPQALRGRAPEARTLSTRSGWGAPSLLPRHSCSRQGCWGPRASLKLSNPSCLEWLLGVVPCPEGVVLLWQAPCGWCPVSVGLGEGALAVTLRAVASGRPRSCPCPGPGV